MIIIMYKATTCQPFHNNRTYLYYWGTTTNKEAINCFREWGVVESLLDTTSLLFMNYVVNSKICILEILGLNRVQFCVH